MCSSRIVIPRHCAAAFGHHGEKLSRNQISPARFEMMTVLQRAE
jgi:hypothetical protein